MNRLPISTALLITLLVQLPSPALSRELTVNIIDSPLTQSHAFEQFRRRPASELSKLIFLLDRFGSTDTEIVYGSRTYKARLVSGIARWHLFRTYDSETAEEWLEKWCYRARPSGDLVWVRTEDGKRALARDVLMRELDLLEAHC